MREILFRGKRVDNGEWIYGMPCATEKSGIYAIQTLCGGIFDIIPETIGQYTGLKDKTGTKIFEGDIIESVFIKKLYLVYFGEHLFDGYDGERYACGWYNEDDCGFVTEICCPDTWAIVIGNIHDNPELLEG